MPWKFSLLAIIALGVGLALAACGGESDADKRPFVCPDPDAPFCPVQKIFARSCAVGSCHVPNGTAPMSLEPERAYDNIINVRTVSYCPGGTRVVPGDPDASCLWQLVRTDVMPLSGAPLSAGDKESIRAWIANGALQ